MQAKKRFLPRGFHQSSIPGISARENLPLGDIAGAAGEPQQLTLDLDADVEGPQQVHATGLPVRGHHVADGQQGRENGPRRMGSRVPRVVKVHGVNLRGRKEDEMMPRELVYIRGSVCVCVCVCVCVFGGWLN